jgi:hypothetical protein
MKFFTLLSTLLFSLAAAAQNSGTLKGKLIDSATKQSLKDASISILDAKDSTVEAFSLAKAEGAFELTGISFGSYLIQISFQGYENVFQKVQFSKENPVADLGTIYMKISAGELEGVTVKSSPIQIKGDTTEMNASSFKTKPNATAEDLLKKMPGMEVQKDGTVKAQGQNVTRVLVDGKKFFSDDPKMATKNLPSDVIDKIQVYDAQSDQSAFSGFDDGNREKTINIITKKDRRKGYFGKMGAGYGENDRFAVSANIHRFNGNQQISFIGQGNNINQQNFSVQDILGAMGNSGGGGGNRGGGGGGNIGNFLSGSQSGIARTWAGGLNYNDVWSKKTSVSGSYFYNNMTTNNDNDNYRETFVNNNPDSSLFSTTKTLSNNKNQNHRFNLEIEHKFDSSNSIQIRPGFSNQHNESYSETSSFSTKGKLINQSNVLQKNSRISDGFNFNTNILIRHRFKKRGRSISLNLNPGMSTNESESRNLADRDIYFGGTFTGKDTTDQISNTERDGKTFSSNVSYTEPVGKKGQLELSYTYNYSLNNSDQKTFQLRKSTGQYDSVVTNLTNKFENTNISNRFSLQYREQLTKELSIMGGIGIQYADLTSNNQTKATNLNNRYTNYFPTFQIQYQKARTNNLRFRYNGRTNAPSITQLQDVIDNSNVLNIKNGNPGLKQEFNHSFNLFYTKFDIVTFKNFVASINGSFTQDKIGNSVYQNTGTAPVIVDGITLIPGARYSKPINLNGGVNVNGFVNFGFPTKRPKANINFSTNVNYSRDVNVYNAVTNYTNNYGFTERISYNMNIKEQFDLNFSSSSTYTLARYTQSPDNNGDYFTQVFSVEPTYSTKNGWVIGSDFDYTIYRGQSAGYNQTIPLLTASISKLIFKKKDGEIKLSVYDLLNQNKSITRTVEQNYVQDTRTQVLTRYVMVSFIYNLRKFAGKGQTQMPPMMKGMFRRDGQPRVRMNGGGPGGL